MYVAETNGPRKIGILLVAALVAMTAGSARAAEDAAAGPDRANLPGLRRAIEDLTKTFGDRYPKGPEYLRRLAAYEKAMPRLRQAVAAGEATAAAKVAELLAFRRETMLANPLLGFDRLLVVRRKPVGDPRRAKGTGRGVGEYIGLPRQSSWQLDRIPKTDNWDNEIATLSPVRPDGKLTTLYRPNKPLLINDVDLHYDAGRLLFSMPDAGKKWQVFEIDTAPPARLGAGGRRLRQVTPTGQGDVHNYDACYLPNGRIAFISTAPLQGVPCNASVNVGMLYVADADGTNIRQLCFDQDHNYCPTVTGDGQILYLRWEYTDIPHVWGRYLFTMNPDGTVQREVYGSGEYWPNSIFYARSIPGQPTRIVGIVTGHHVGRVGELVILDTGRGLNAHRGVVQRICGDGPVEPLIQDKLTEHSWPKFLHPMPLADPSGGGLAAGRYFLVSAKPTPKALWGIYLVDVFDNMTRIKELAGHVLLEPIPIVKRPRPPVLADRVDLRRTDALMYLEDIYAGDGLKGVPRGAVKKLRLFTYHFVYQKMAGINHNVGVDGPWEPKRVLGTVPVEPDGSAFFRVPANTPISIQPIDEKGQALQLMRSWTTAMPGEFVSCVGCHERRTDAAGNRGAIAARRTPREIDPWGGPVRGFSFRREVQPVLDRHCVGCHDGRPREDGRQIADLRRDQGRLIAFRNSDPKPEIIEGKAPEKLFAKYGGVFDPSFIELRRHIRVGGFESDIRVLDPGEFHADTSPLIQMLMAGHHGVRLDAKAWERLFVWIDLNAPSHGTWREVAGVDRTKHYPGRRRELRKMYAGIADDPEAYPAGAEPPPVEPIVPKQAPARPATKVDCPGWPFDAAEARDRQARAATSLNTPGQKSIDLGGGVKLDLTLIPAGQFVMGDPDGHRDERPASRVAVDRAFWVGTCEVTNEQYARFDPAHDSRFEHKGSWIFSEHHLGWRVNHPRQPVVRVSWLEAEAFCRWLGRRTGLAVKLPTEAQWEYACRAGTHTPLFYGGEAADFSKFANLADVTIRDLAYDTDGRYTADLVPRQKAVNDGQLVTADVGSFRPNAWGLADVHGNAWEWTRSAHRPYPYRADDGRNAPDAPGRRVVRGGSWRDLPKRSGSACRLSYPAWRRVFNVGFRVVVQTSAAGK
jgi:formylglycine-generating enzyme required for sulfatase activity